MGTHPIFESDFDCLTELRKMSDDVTPTEFINELNVFQVIQLYLVNDVTNENSVYSILYQLMNDIKTTINVKEYNDTLNGNKIKSDELLDVIIKKLTHLKTQIQEKNSGKPTSPPVYRLSSSSLKPRPHFNKKPKLEVTDNQPFEIFNAKKRKRDETKINSPADFFGGTTGQRIQSASESSSTEQSIESDLLQGEVILEPWSEENIESTPVTKKPKSEEVARVSSRKSTNPRKLLPSMMKKKRKPTPSQPLRRSPRKTPQKKGVIVIDESPQTKTIGLISSDKRAKSEMERSRRKLELDDAEHDMVEIGKDILDSEDTDPEDDVPLANLQPVLANSTQIKTEPSEPLKTPSPSKKLKKKREEFFTISSVIKPPSAVEKRSRRSPVKSPQNINERYRATSLAFSQMLNPDYIPPAADDVLDSPKKAKTIEPRNLSRTMSDDIDELGSQPPELEDMDDTLAEPLPDSSDELDNDEEALALIQEAHQKNEMTRPEPPVTPKKRRPSSSPFTTPRKTPRKTPQKRTPRKTPVKRTPKKTPTRTSPRKTPRKAVIIVNDPDVNKNEKKKKKKTKKKKKSLNLRALA